MGKGTCSLAVCCFLFLLAQPVFSFGSEIDFLGEPDDQVASKPNIVLILADDLGFSDLGSYGSEIRTPTLDHLAAQGVRFTNYHTAANCAPARAMLLTGVDSHLAGVPNIPEMLSPSQRMKMPGAGSLSDNVVTVASLLEQAGYRTYMSGKWHLGMEPDKRPIAQGFQRTVAMMDSGADHWEQRPYIPLYDQANWFSNGERLELPEDFYSSEFLVDKLMEFIDNDSEQKAPFFAYLPLMAVHLPLQAPQDHIEHYADTYRNGWDALRQARRQAAESLGIIPANTPMVRMPTTLDWEDLDDETQRYEAKRMAVYAGMVEAMDANIGRLIDFLRHRGDYANTIFIFTSDNGAESTGPVDPQSFLQSYLAGRMGYSVNEESLGLKGSFGSLSPSFASAAVSPLAFYKFYVGEGGMRVPLVVAGEKVPLKQQINNSFAWVTDIAPTILGFAGVSAPGSRFGGRSVEPMKGRSLEPVVMGRASAIHRHDEAVGYELAGHAALFQGDYKLVKNQGPVGDGRWRLFNIVTDPGEVINLANAEPLRFQRMLGAYLDYEAANQVFRYPPGYSALGQVYANALRQELGSGPIALLLTGVLLLPFLVAYRRRRP